MNKKDIKVLLMSMRNSDNEREVNNLLGEIDLLSEEKIETIVAQIGNDEQNISKYLQEKLNARHEHELGNQKHTPINKMFSYGISGSSIHLHMPFDLHQMISKMGMLKTIDMVNLYLLDAIEKIRKMQNDGYYKFADKDSIYMISPILLGREIKFLTGLDFKTNTYKKKDLQDEHFVAEHPEAQLAIKIFGEQRNIGSAIIGLDVINSIEWQQKKEEFVESLRGKGIELIQEEVEKE